MLKYVCRTINDRLSFPYRNEHLTLKLAQQLERDAIVLDVGTGDGRLASLVQHTTPCTITGLDIYPQPHKHIDIHYYDGCYFPFADNAFDCVMMVDMLHHTLNMDQVLAEARRVSRRHVIIKDHYWENRLDRVALRMGDYIGNLPYNVALPYNFLSLDQWQGLFQRHQLHEVSRVNFKFHTLEPGKHFVTKLELNIKPQPQPQRMAVTMPC